MEQFFRDKSKLFECNLSIEGANINDTKARLVLQFEDKTNLLFYGNIDKSGKCSIIVPPLKEHYKNKGTAILEVIADSTYFESWSDTFELDTSKKVMVERIESTQIFSKPKVYVNEEIILERFSKYLKENKITLQNLPENKERLPDLLIKYAVINKKKSKEIQYIMENITNCINYL